jgi:hypothetical protein
MRPAIHQASDTTVIGVSVRQFFHPTVDLSSPGFSSLRANVLKRNDFSFGTAVALR